MIEIKGRIPSKKNSKKIFVVKGRLVIAPSTDYSKWHKDATEQIEAQRSSLFSEGTDKLGKEIRIVFFAGDLRKYDLTNKAESIMDLLVDTKLIEDDNYECVPKLTLEFGGLDRDNPRAEIYG